MEGKSYLTNIVTLCKRKLRSDWNCQRHDAQSKRVEGHRSPFPLLSLPRFVLPHTPPSFLSPSFNFFQYMSPLSLCWTSPLFSRSPYILTSPNFFPFLSSIKPHFVHSDSPLRPFICLPLLVLPITVPSDSEFRTQGFGVEVLHVLFCKGIGTEDYESEDNNGSHQAFA